MKALLFAAGRGERMRPLSDETAKPLLRAGGRRLIEWQIDALVRAGVREIVVNTAHLALQIEETLGDGRRYGTRLRYSREGERAEDALETLGGIVRAAPLLGAAPFIAASSDIVTDFDYGRLAAPLAAVARGEIDAHLVLVDNPPFHAAGDMGLADGRILCSRRGLCHRHCSRGGLRCSRNQGSPVRRNLSRRIPQEGCLSWSLRRRRIQTSLRGQACNRICI